MPKEPSSPCPPLGFLVHSIEHYHQRKDMGAAILKQVAVITRDFNIMDEEEPEAVVEESDELAHIDMIMDVKR